MKNNNHTKDPQIILFWSVPSITEIEQYKLKCRELLNAISHKRAIRILSSNDKVCHLKQIKNENGSFYGFTSGNGKKSKFRINVNKIASLRLEKDVLNICYKIIL